MKKNKKEIKPLNCEEAVTRFNDFMDNNLKGKSREELVKHISECRHCFDRLEFEQLLKSKVQQISSRSIGTKNKSLVNRIEKIIASL
ncbi:MAG TPA: zf-HC2 domain-containing protein [Chitinophagales bacterium]|nr:zf-HC2 domain-containing protein [Chitinophagales bacterium]